MILCLWTTNHVTLVPKTHAIMEEVSADMRLMMRAYAHALMMYFNVSIWLDVVKIVFQKLVELLLFLFQKKLSKTVTTRVN